MIKAIEIEIGGKTIKLSPEEARQLYQELDGILSKPCTLPHYSWPYYWQWQPYHWNPTTINADAGRGTTWTTTATDIPLTGGYMRIND